MPRGHIQSNAKPFKVLTITPYNAQCPIYYNKYLVIEQYVFFLNICTHLKGKLYDDQIEIKSNNIVRFSAT